MESPRRPGKDDLDQRWIDHCLKCGAEYRHDEGEFCLCPEHLAAFYATEHHHPNSFGVSRLQDWLSS